MVDFSYLENGVRIAGAWYPIVKMRWVEGHGNRILFLDETEQNAFQDVGGEAAFERSGNSRRSDDAKDRRIAQLQAKLVQKHEVISELMEENVLAKKSIGEP
jgi:hypothetical protein